MLDAAAEGLAADGSVANAHQLEDVGDRANHVAGPEHVATKVENDVRLLHVVLRRR